MCGRYATTRSADDLARLFAAFDETEGAAEGVLAPDYNLAPTDPAPIVRLLHGAASGVAALRVLSVARWGLVPVWADHPRIGARMINARSETVATARAYAASFKGKRCLVPADGWFEWATIDGRKQPHFMTVPEGFAFAGLWAERPARSDGAATRGSERPARSDGAATKYSAGRFGLSFSIITTAAVGDLARIHDRMPLLLEPDRWEEWLTAPVTDGTAAEALLAPPPPSYVASIEIRPVGPAVGNVRNDGPELIARAGDAQAHPEIQERLF
jgi:putative SOS response-associated peptidase YedK